MTLLWIVQSNIFEIIGFTQPNVLIQYPYLTGGWTALEEIDEGTEVTLDRLCEKLNELECTAPLELLLFEY